MGMAQEETNAHLAAMRRERDAALARASSVPTHALEERDAAIAALQKQVATLHAEQAAQSVGGGDTAAVEAALAAAVRARDESAGELDRQRRRIGELEGQVAELLHLRERLETDQTVQSESFGATAAKLQREGEATRAALAEKTRLADELGMEVGSLRDAVGRLEAEAARQSASFEDAVRRLQTERDAALMRSSEASAGMAALADLKARTQQLEDLKREHAALVAARGDAESGMAQQQQSYEALVAQISGERDAAAAARDMAQNRLANAERLAAAAEEGKSRVETDAAAQREAQAAALNAAKRELEALRLEADQREARCAEMERELAGERGNRGGAEARLDAQRQAFETASARLQRERDAALAEAAAVRAETVPLTALNAKDELMGNMQRELASLREGKLQAENALRAAHAAVESKVAEIQNERDASQRAAEEARNMVTTARAEMRDATAERDDALSRLNEAETRKRQLTGQVASAQATAQQLESRCAQLEQELTSANDQAARGDMAAGEVSALRAQLDKLGRQVDVQEAKAREATRRLTDTMAERDQALDQAARAAAAAERAGEPMGEEQERLRRQVADLERQLGVLRQEGRGMQGGDGAMAALHSAQREREAALRQLNEEQTARRAAEIALEQIRAVGGAGGQGGSAPEDETSRMASKVEMLEQHARLQREQVAMLTSKLHEAQESLRSIASQGDGTSVHQAVVAHLNEAESIARRASQQGAAFAALPPQFAQQQPQQQQQQQQWGVPAAQQGGWDVAPDANRSPPQYTAAPHFSTLPQSAPQQMHPIRNFQQPPIAGASYINMQRGRRGPVENV